MTEGLRLELWLAHLGRYLEKNKVPVPDWIPTPDERPELYQIVDAE